MLDDIAIGAEVYGSDGQKLGELRRIVVEQGSDRVTHLVIDPGLLASGNLLAPGGWEKPRDHIVPIEWLAEVNGGELRLTQDKAAFERTPHFESEQFEDATLPDPSATPTTQGTAPSWRSRFHLGEVVNYLAAGVGIGAAPYQPGDEEVVLNEAPRETALAEGAPVWRRTPHEQIGEVARVLFDETTQRIRALVIRRRTLSDRLDILPIEAVSDLDEGVAHVELTDAQLDALETYPPR